MERRMAEYINPKLELRRCGSDSLGLGLFARGTIVRGEIVIVANGKKISVEEWMKLPERKRAICYDIGGGLVMCPSDFEHLSLDWYMNHSCDPNVGCSGDLKTLVAMRDIGEGEEAVMDYAMTDESAWWNMACECGSALCRGRVTGQDWKLPELQERYRGYFQANIRMKIEAEAGRAAAG